MMMTGNLVPVPQKIVSFPLTYPFDIKGLASLKVLKL